MRDVFYDSLASKAGLRIVGEKLMMSLYDSKCSSLDEQRYLTYCRKVGSGGVKKKRCVNPDTLPSP